VSDPLSIRRGLVLEPKFVPFGRLFSGLDKLKPPARNSAVDCLSY